MKDTLAIIATIVLVLVLVIGGCHLRYEAYRQRYPNAEPWTFWFQDGH